MVFLPIERLKHASLATKITLVGALTIVVTLCAGSTGLLLLYWRYQANESSLRHARETRISYAVSTLKKEQQNFVHDYGIWDKMAKALESQDIAWLENAFVGSHETFQTDYAVIFASNSSPLVRLQAPGKNRLPPETLLSQAASQISARESTYHTHFQETDGHLWVIMAGPVASHTNTDRPIVGTIVIACLWDQEELSSIEYLLDAKLVIDTKTTDRSTSADHISVPLESGSPYILHAHFDNRSLTFLWDSLRIFVLVTLAAGIVLIFLSHRIEYILILNPLAQLTRKLRAQSIFSTQEHSCPNEIEMLERLIDSFLQQNTHMRKLSRIVDESTNAVALAGLDGSLTYVNPSWEKLNGYTSAEVLGKNPRILQSGKTPKNLYSQMWATLLAGKPFLSRDVVNRRKDGSEYFCFLSVFPIQDGGVTFGYAAIQLDISQEKEVDRMKTEFISMASHQLRTPLSAMRWFGELLLAGKAGDLAPKQKEMVSNLQSSTMRMIALVNALLDITRLESGRIIIEPEPTDLDALVQELLTELTPRIQAKSIALQTQIPTNIPVVNLDKKMIHEVYANLLTNAIKYTPEKGSISVKIMDDGEQILSSVADTGIGIPISEREQVFSKFYRGSNVQRLETDGTGLGLYLVKAIIESSGGRIWFESTPHMGTTFTFAIPKSGMEKKSGSVRIGS